MTKEQILKKAIEKAEKNGYKLPINQPLRIEPQQATYEIFRGTQNDIIFSHNFAKAFWGEKRKEGDTTKVFMSEILEQENCSPWQHHLRRMVLCKEPLKYVEKFL